MPHAGPAEVVSDLVSVLRTNGSRSYLRGGEAFLVPALRFEDERLQLGLGLPIGVTDDSDDWALVGVLSISF